MDMGFNNWMALESAMQGDQPRRTPSRATLRRVLAFARPHRRDLIGFLVLSVVGATLTVATPVLAGRVVDAIIERATRGGSSGSPWSSPCSPSSMPASGSPAGGCPRGSARG